MDLHRLKVVKFDKSLENISNTIEVIGDVAKNTKCFITNECEINRKIHNNYADNNKRQKIQTPYIIYRSKSEPLKVCPKEKCFRKHKRRKPINFDEIKNNFTYKYTFKPMHLPKLIKGKECAKRNKVIKVLFAREVSRLTKKDRNFCCSIKQRNTKVGTFAESNNSYDIFGFQNKKYSVDHPSKQYRCDKGCITKKFSKLQLRHKINKLSQPKNKPKSVTERQPLKLLKTRSSKLRISKSESICCLCNIARHYNLVCFPENNISPLREQNTTTITVSPKNIPIYPSAYFRDCACKDQQVSVTPSRLQTRKKPLGDAGVATSGSLCNNCIKSTRGNYAPGPFCRIRRIPKSTRRGRFLSHTLGTTKKIIPKELLRYHGNRIRTFLKCVLLVLVIIAWIPCIITVLLCWILTYPLRPHFIKTKRYKNDEHLRKRTPLTQIMNTIKCMANKAAYSIKAMLSLLRNNDAENILYHRPTTHSRGCPNPKKKYTLFYTDHRGWRIKPIRVKNIGVRDCHLKAFHNPNLKTINNKNIVKRKCCGCKLNNVEKNIKADTSPYHHEMKYKNQSQNTKCCKRLNERSQRLNVERNSPEYQINRPRIRSKSHPLPYNSHEKQTIMKPPCLRNSLSSPLPINMTVARRKRKNKFTRHHFPSSCEPCIKWKRYKTKSKPAKQNMKYTYCKTNKKLHARCGCGSKHHKKNKSYFKRLWYFIRSSYVTLARIIDESEDVAWKEDINCDTYLDTLENKPCPWINRRCPAVYPCITVWLKCIRSTWHMAVYTLSFCVWCPVMCCCYVFSELFWQCLK